MDEIRIDNLEIYAHHGVYPQEREKGQLFYVNAVLALDLRPAGRSDDLDLSVDYGEICRFITDRMKESACYLIEAAAEKLAENLLLKYDLIQCVRLEIRKPHAPIGLPFESVSVRIERGWHQVYLSMGSNMGDKEAYLRQGIEALQEHPLVRVQKVSSKLLTKPYGGVEQEDFLNAAAAVKTLLTPQELLSLLHEIEADAGRERKVHWGPRTLDMDILLYDRLVLGEDELVIPHADMQNRYFVLKPLSEIAPNQRHPLLGKTVTEMLLELPEPM